MMLLDAFIRFSAIGIVTLLPFIALRDFRSWKGTPYLILTCISICALFLGYAPDTYRPSGLFYQILRLLDVPHLVFIWLLVLVIFQNDFTLKRSHIFICGIYCLPIFWLRLAGPSSISLLLIYWVSAASLLLMIHLCFQTVVNFKDDLSDSRRKFRVYFLILICFVTLASAISEVMLINAPKDIQYTMKVISIWPAIILGAYWMLGFRTSSVLFGNPQKKQNSHIKQQDESLKNKLLAEMNERKAFKETDLTIVSLAKRLGVTQHSLRKFINQSLGYTNFSSFLNSYRLKEAKSALTDKDLSQKSILVIALDAGFNSLPSFNRVFKLTEGITPTEYRKHHQK